MAEYMGKEEEMLAQAPLTLPEANETKGIWEKFLKDTPALKGEGAEWKFCVPEVLYPDSILFLGLNPSASKDHEHTRFDLQGLIDHGHVFNPLRKIAARLKLPYSYFDLFCARTGGAADLIRRLPGLLGRSEGVQAVAAMLALPRRAVETVQPKAIYVCNGTAGKILRGEVKSLARTLEEAGIEPVFSFAHDCLKMECKEVTFYYTVLRLNNSSIPVVLGIDLAGAFLTREKREKAIDFIVKALREAIDNPEG